MKMRKELNNKGFSLVELLIATMILGIVVVPLLHTFVVSAKTTARGSQLGDVVLASENVAEGVEAVSIYDLFTTSNIGNYIPGASGQKLYKPAAGGGYTELTASDSLTAPYYLGMKVQAGGSAFNAMVTLDPEGDYGGGTGLNDLPIADYANMDAAFVQTRDGDDPDKVALASFKTKADGLHSITGGWDMDSVKPFRRTMTLNIYSKSEAPNKVFAKLDLLYEYQYTSWTEDPNTHDITYETEQLSADLISYELIPQGFSIADNKYPNIYLIYFPLYGCIEPDKINIENTVAQPLNIFLVKQLDNSLSATDLLTKERNYRAELVQSVPNRTSPRAVVYSNIREDLSTPNNQLLGVTYKVRYGYEHSSGVFGGTEGDLVSKSARDRIFKTKVEIFEASDSSFSNPIHTFHSTKLQ